MESKEPSTVTPPEIVEQKGIRQTIQRKISGMFDGPYLPTGLILFFGEVVLTQFAYILILQPLPYWLDHSQGLKESLPIFVYGPFAALGIYLVYIAVMAAILSVLNRPIALVLWSAAVYGHLAVFSRVAAVCGTGIFSGPLCNIFKYSVVLVIGLILGIALARNLLRAEVSAPQPAGQGWLKTRLGLSRLGASLTGAWLLLLATGIVVTARIPANGWQPVHAGHFPSGRYETMVAYDSGRSKTVIFGGVIETSGGNWSKTAETWEWNGQDWKQIQPEKSPQARSRGGLAYDKKQGVVILFGGWNDLDKSLNDTWEWDGKNWKELCSNCNPPPRGCFDMFYDTRRKQVVLYGGCGENNVFFNDAWGWNGVDWDRIDLNDSPLASGSPIIYDPQNQRAVGFLAGFPTGTWIWNDSGWAKPEISTEPSLRANPQMAFDPTTGNILMFGGQNDEGKSLYNDTWLLKGTTWKEIKSGLQPPGRWGHIVFFDPTRGKFMLFGGFGKEILNDMWEFTYPAGSG